MRETDLPYPGAIVQSLELRKATVRAISGIQVSVRPSGKHPAARELAAFFTAAAAFLAPFVEVALPAVTAAPAITGTAKVGSTLTVTNGTWTGSPTFTRQWYRNGAPIENAKALTYVPKADDIGKTLTVKVEATNAGGQVYADSAATAVVVA